MVIEVKEKAAFMWTRPLRTISQWQHGVPVLVQAVMLRYRCPQDPPTAPEPFSEHESQYMSTGTIILATLTIMMIVTMAIKMIMMTMIMMTMIMMTMIMIMMIRTQTPIIQPFTQFQVQLVIPLQLQR